MTVIITARHSHDIRRERRHVGLAVAVEAPGDGGSIGAQGEVVVIACRYGYELQCPL